MNGAAGILQVLDSLHKHGLVFVLLIVILVITWPLWKSLIAWLLDKLIARPEHEMQIAKLYAAALDPITEEPILLRDLRDRVCDMDSRERCIPSQCPFHDILVEKIENYIEEGRIIRDAQAKRMDELFSSYEKVSDAHIGIISRFLERPGSTKN